MTTQTLRQPAPVPVRPDGGPGREAAAPAPAWAALGIRTRDRVDSTLAAVLGRRFGSATLLRLSGGGGQLLVPAPDRQQALRLAHQVREDLGDGVWISVAWGPYEELGSGVREMTNVLTVVCALNRRPGVYQLGDVAVECAVANSPAVSRCLAALIEPVVTRPELMETLKALIEADGNRARAASELIIHRSTIDYRLQRIEQLTGHSPTSVGGMRTLCTALAARALLRLQGTSSPG
ncbi:helix-turn-helix domain-containing protein [Streptomyces canus]|uniref:PucR family transcriptional regulator n=1 Tax=Streptomyces canus TaxID=58343 RepID=UPI002254B45E|nr:helix-turn-helix domain-containing protein [Streptomyces canus]MCX5257813.1 helix-turn-helix domain-containing protein [Streptomyces canus]